MPQKPKIPICSDICSINPDYFYISATKSASHTSDTPELPDKTPDRRQSRLSSTTKNPHPTTKISKRIAPIILAELRIILTQVVSNIFQFSENLLTLKTTL